MLCNPVIQIWTLIATAVITATAESNSSNSMTTRRAGGRPYSFDYLIAADDYFDTTVTVVFLDYDVEEEVVAKYNLAGKTVFCVVNSGSWEFWREDANKFPAEILGNDYEGWPGEKWLDVRDTQTLIPIIRERFQSAARKGCKGVAADNLIAWNVPNTGFDITPQDQLVYNRFIAAEIKVLGMMAGLNSNDAQAPDLVNEFDFGLTLGCVSIGGCDDFEVFAAVGKPVFGIESKANWDEESFRNEVCPLGNTIGFSFTLKNEGRETADYMLSCV